MQIPRVAVALSLGALASRGVAIRGVRAAHLRLLDFECRRYNALPLCVFTTLHLVYARALIIPERKKGLLFDTLYRLHLFSLCVFIFPSVYLYRFLSNRLYQMELNNVALIN